MKNSLLICFFIMGFSLVAGCLNGEKPISPETSDAQTPELILKPGDATGLALTDFRFYAFPQNRPYNITNYYNIKEYEDVLPADNRNVGQRSIWKDSSGREISIELMKLDSNSKLKGYFEIKTKFFEEKMNGTQDVLDADVGYPAIGDSSYYYYAVPKNEPDVAGTRLEFAHKNYIGLIRVTGNKDKSLNEAIRIAKIVENRLG